MTARFRPSEHRSFRKGVTFIELVVAIAVISTIASVSVIAVQTAKHAARRADCANRLRQSATAILLSEDATGSLPLVKNLYSQIYPYLESAPLAEQLLTGNGPKNDLSLPLTPSPSAVLCPEDSYADASVGATSYLPNGGVPPLASDAPKVTRRDASALGPFKLSGFSMPVTSASIIDGRSATAMISERLMSPLDTWPVDFPRSATVLAQTPTIADRSRYHWWVTEETLVRDQFSQFINLCKNTDFSQWEPNRADTGWLRTFHQSSEWYTHSTHPNSNSCVNSPRTTAVQIRLGITMGSTPATSAHDSGANVAMCDGSVRFASNHVDLEIWQALGTIAGSEPSIGRW